MRFGNARVSTRDQNPDSQLDALTGPGCERVFVDRALGKLARRPNWDQLDEQLRARDELVVTRRSRLARSMMRRGARIWPASGPQLARRQ
jgi:DNA invertase Pin-like site-specific DNA recombinase